jgi:hypothetical protein
MVCSPYTNHPIFAQVVLYTFLLHFDSIFLTTRSLTTNREEAVLKGITDFIP